MASRKKQVCIPVAQAKKLGLSTAKKKTLAEVLKTPEGKRFSAVKKAYERESRNASDTTCSIVSSVANKYRAHAESLAERYKDSGDLTPKQARAIAKAGNDAVKRATAVCKIIDRREKTTAKRERKISALSGRRRRR